MIKNSFAPTLGESGGFFSFASLYLPINSPIGIAIHHKVSGWTLLAALLLLKKVFQQIAAVAAEASLEKGWQQQHIMKPLLGPQNSLYSCSLLFPCGYTSEVG